MKIGAAWMIRAWGREMTLLRDGVPLVSFKGKKYEVRAHEAQVFQLDYSVDQEIIFVVVAFEDMNGVIPQKMDRIRFDTKPGMGAAIEYTVQRSHEAGADEDEVYRILLKGGIT